MEASAIGEHETGNCWPRPHPIGDVIIMDEFVLAGFVKAEGLIAQFDSSRSTGHGRAGSYSVCCRW
jgi:hypothetical protein